MNYQFNWSVIWQYHDSLIAGLEVTLELFILSVILSLGVGLIVGIGRSSSNPIIKRLSSYYVHLFRNIPVIVKLFFFYFAFGLNSFEAAVVSLVLHQSAYIAEVILSGIQSTSADLLETCLSFGLTKPQAFSYIVMPVAFRLIIPPLTSQLINVLKNTVIASTISLQEVNSVVRDLIYQTYHGFELYTFMSICFLIIASIVSLVMDFIDRKTRITL
jgi:polar amino acid transport system permease protein